MRSRAELYDWELAHAARRTDQDLPFYSQLAASAGGPVLELACGTGRLTVPLGAVGLDVDAAMLAVARRRGARQLVRADMRRFALARRFALVVLAYNSLQLLVDDDDLLSCLRCAATHLLPHGALDLEVSDFQAGAVTASVGPQLLGSAHGVSLHGALVHDFARRVTTYHRRFEEGGEARVDHVRLRCLDGAELESLLGRAGLAVRHVAEVEAGGPAGSRLYCVATPASPASSPAEASSRAAASATALRARLA